MLTFGLMFTAATMHAGAITTAGNTGTMIGLVNGIKWGLGKRWDDFHFLFPTG